MLAFNGIQYNIRLVFDHIGESVNYIYVIEYYEYSYNPVHVLEQRTVFNKKDFSLKIRFDKK